MPVSDSSRALLAFHRGAGLRVALRASIVVVCSLVFVFGSAPEILYTLYRFVLGVASAAAGPDALRGLALVGLGLAVPAAARVRLGTAGWLRTLPASGDDHRRGTWAALALAQLPVLVAGALCAVLTVAVYRAPLAPAKLAGLPLAVAATSAALVPSARGWAARPLALGAAFLATLGTGWGVAGAVLGLLLADRAAGPIRPERRRARRRLPLPVPTELLVVGRALGWRAVADGALAVLLPLAGAWFFRANNPLPPQTAALAARVGGAVAAAFLAAALAGALLRRRNPWPWARSLPWSGARRVAADAAALALAGAPLLAVVGWMDPAAVPTTGLALGVSACVAAGALRGDPERKTGAAGETLRVAVPAGVGLAFFPAAWPLGAALAAAALRLGGRRERGQRVSRWTELHHGSAGDSAWQGAP